MLLLQVPTLSREMVLGGEEETGLLTAVAGLVRGNPRAGSEANSKLNRNQL